MTTYETLELATLVTALLVAPLALWALSEVLRGVARPLRPAHHAVRRAEDPGGFWLAVGVKLLLAALPFVAYLSLRLAGG